MKYEVIEIEDAIGKHITIMRTDDDGTIWAIPVDEANSDYQAYLLWLAEQPTLKAGK